VVYLDHQGAPVPGRRLAAHAAAVWKKAKRDDERLEAMTADPAGTLSEDPLYGVSSLLLAVWATGTTWQD